MSGESPLSVESQHLMIPTSEVLRFLHEKGYNTAGEGLSTFFDEEDSPEVDLDVTREQLDLTHLLDDWTTVGAQELANELLVWLGIHDY